MVNSMLLASAALMAATAQVSAVTWSRYGNMEYFIKMNNKANRGKSATYCSKEGGYGGGLATIDSAELNDFIFQLNPFSSRKRWIALRRYTSRCTGPYQWEWDDKTAYDDSASVWITGQPNNKRCTEKCVMQGSFATNPYPVGGWEDVRCAMRAGAVCQRPAAQPVHKVQLLALTFDSCPNKVLEAAKRDQLTMRIRNSAWRECRWWHRDTNPVNVEDVNGVLKVTSIMREETWQKARVYQGMTENMITCASKISSAVTSYWHAKTCTESAVMGQATSCSDGRQNGGELGVDCGGVCGGDCNAAANHGSSGGDPHFVVNLNDSLALCYDVHGRPGKYLSLINTPTTMVNTLVINAPASVDGTYHGAIGIAATSTSSDVDRVVVLSDGTVSFNAKTFMRSNETIAFTGSAVSVTVEWSHVKVVGSDGFEFTIHFMDADKSRAHLDFALDKSPTNLDQAKSHGILGQFIGATSSLKAINKTDSFLTVNKRMVEVSVRSMPQVAGSKAENCYKYFDSQAEGLLQGHMSDYVTHGMFAPPTNANFSRFGQYQKVEKPYIVESYVDQLAESEKGSVDSTILNVKDVLQHLDVKQHLIEGPSITVEDLRNTLIDVTARKTSMDVQELQSLSTDRILHIVSAEL